jgi:hypothetical protein
MFRASFYSLLLLSYLHSLGGCVLVIFKAELELANAAL